MTTIRNFCMNDLFQFSSINIDHLSLLMNAFTGHYQTLSTKWSEYLHVAIAPGNRIIGYIIRVHEANLPDGNKGQVLAVSVLPEYPRLKVATDLMKAFEKQLVIELSSLPRVHDYYVFIYIGVYNNPAKRFFVKNGFRTVKTLPKFFPQYEDENANRMSKIIDR